MKLQTLVSPTAPAAIGPYSHGRKFGDMIITSGQVPFRKDGTMETDIQLATQIVLENLLSVVEAGGGRKDSIAKVDVFVRDLGDFAKINQVYSAFFGELKPARVLVQVADLPAGAGLEAAVIAFVVD
ncbi:Rid family detoxifying hydrolase [Bengtsoniella intestinalis]|uniref:RidA family protein n=1 Tax=Bengtsoniella intestinalis TaxID=3073143 RepID=UPI00391F757F